MKKYVLLIILLLVILIMPVSAKEEGRVFYWSFEGHGRDHSKEYLDFDAYNDLDYGKGVVGSALDLRDSTFTIYTDYVDYDFENYTVAMWVYLDKDVPSDTSYQICLAKDTKRAGHFEIFFMRVGDSFILKVYTLDLGDAFDYITPVKYDEWMHIAASYDGSVQRLYLNGEVVFQKELNIDLEMASSEYQLAIGSLIEGGFDLYGLIDEVVLSDYALDSEMIGKLHSDPEGAAKDIKKMVEDDYPEGQTPRPDVTPEPTPAPTKEPASETQAPKETDKVTKTKEPTDKGKSNKLLIPIIIVVTVVVAGVIVFLILKPKKK